MSARMSASVGTSVRTTAPAPVPVAPDGEEQARIRVRTAVRSVTPPPHARR
jgi:hypothetical protein